MADYESAGAEVAEDFRSALEDMKTVLRLEIMNLCQIARENTEFAVDIAETLQTFILEAAPQRKLPALYVLDAIVKNVGTPYTLYLAPKLYKMFMESYATVDANVRRKMEEMLRTWKQPVPGSIDTRPVFPLEVVNPIENALLKASSSAVQAQQKISGRPHAVMRNSPVSSDRTNSPYPGQHTEQQQAQQQAQMMRRTVSRDMGTPVNHPGMGVPVPVPAAAPPVTTPTLTPTAASLPVDIEKLKIDVVKLIRNLQIAGSHYPHDETIAMKTRALMDLQGLFNHVSALLPEQLIQIRQQVDDLSASTLVLFGHLFPPSNTHTPTPPAAPRVTLDSILGAGAMAALLKRQTPTPTPSATFSTAPPPQLPTICHSPAPPSAPTVMRSQNMGIPQAATIVPVMTPSVAPTPTPPPAAATPTPPASSVSEAMGLMQQLRRAGILPPTPSGQPAAAPAPVVPQIPQVPRAVPAPMPLMPAGLPRMPVLPPIIANALAAQRQKPQQWRPPQVEKEEILLDAASLKADRSHLLPTMLDGLGKPCSQCGRRFTNDEAGRNKRVSHMDWHFNVHQRSMKAEKRGQHRSWYLDGKAWAVSRESLDAELLDSAPSTNAAPQAPQVQYIPVPDPSEGINTACSICADKFVNKWLDSAQEWVWLDTMRVGNKAYHASCYGEAFRSRNTPEPVLGKRKAESPVAGGLLGVEGKKWRAEIS